MIPRFRAWKKAGKELGRVGQITFELDGSVSHVLFKGKFLDFNVPINEIILMKSTGFKDNNDKEIFEGDVLTSQNYPAKGVVEFRTDSGMWVNCLKEYGYFEYLGNVASSRKIIGNIYENPELLEDKE